MSIIPPFLQAGDQVHLISPSSPSNSLNWLKGKEVLESWGLSTSLSQNINLTHNGLAGTDEQRLDDLQDALDNPDIKAIFPIRGGYGLTRIIDYIDFTKFIEKPKWIVGFSDITALHLALSTLDIASIHGPMPNNFLENGSSNKLDLLKGLLFGKAPNLQLPEHSLNKKGKLEGKIIGGNLSLITQTLGTSSFPNPDKKILFIEDVGEKYYHIDRMMVQLKRSGLLEYIQGMIVGQFSECEEAKLTIGMEPYEIIDYHLEDYSFPVFYNAPMGHVPTNLPIYLNKEVTISSKGIIRMQ